MKSCCLGLALLMFSSLCEAQEVIEYDNAQLVLIDNVEVASLDAGVVQQIQIQPGQKIGKDELLVGLDDEVYATESKAAELQALIAKQESENDVNLRFAQKSTMVNEKLLAKSLNSIQEYAKSISDTEIDRLKLERDQSQLSYEQAELEGEIAGLTLELRKQQKKGADILLKRRNIKSPINGLVVDVNVQVGESVAAGQVIARIISLDKLRVKAFYQTKYAFRIRKGAKAFLEIDLEGEKVRIPATISFVSPEIRVSIGDFEVWADVDNSERKLLPGMKGVLFVEL